MKRVAYYGGSFDPVHRGHLTTAHAVLEQFELDEFVFIPAFHAPHKVRVKPTSAYDRYAMLCLITQNETRMSVSKMEIEMPEKPYSVETLTRIKTEHRGDEIFFIIGSDSWMEITTWREWENVLTMSNHIVVSRPGYKICVSHVTDQIRERIIDRRKSVTGISQNQNLKNKSNIFLTDLVNLDISSSEIRAKIRKSDGSWSEDVPAEVAIYVKKYQIYK